MCGIVGYIGGRDAAPVLIDSLRKLEYRGYDSAGIAVLDGRGISLRRSEGKLARLETLLAEAPVQGHAGIGHTRWATHGGPSEANAHPHRAGDTVVVHNGIIENYLELREALLGRERGADLGHRHRARGPSGGREARPGNGSAGGRAPDHPGDPRLLRPGVSEST